MNEGLEATDARVYSLPAQVYDRFGHLRPSGWQSGVDRLIRFK
jgi:hypothetical protein